MQMEIKGTEMTLDDAIQHCMDVYKENLRICEMAQDVGIENDHYKQCALEHLQLHKWLTELEYRRENKDSCEFCKYKDRKELERPCSLCKNSYRDMYEVDYSLVQKLMACEED